MHRNHLFILLKFVDISCVYIFWNAICRCILLFNQYFPIYSVSGVQCTVFIVEIILNFIFKKVYGDV